MFSRKDQLLKKTGPDGVGRYEFLKQLINEFATTRSIESKRQTLANLANFAYDPINYEYIKQLHITDLFVRELTNNSEELIHFALAGLTNLCCDPELRDCIINLNGIYIISNLLYHNNQEISLNALSSLFYLFESESIVPQPDIIEKVQLYEQSENPRLKNLGTIFLQTYVNKND